MKANDVFINRLDLRFVTVLRVTRNFVYYTLKAQAHKTRPFTLHVDHATFNERYVNA